MVKGIWVPSLNIEGTPSTLTEGGGSGSGVCVGVAVLAGVGVVVGVCVSVGVAVAVGVCVSVGVGVAVNGGSMAMPQLQASGISSVEPSSV